MSSLIKKSTILDEVKRLFGLDQNRALRRLQITIRHDSEFIELECVEFATSPEQETVHQCKKLST